MGRSALPLIDSPFVVAPSLVVHRKMVGSYLAPLDATVPAELDMMWELAEELHVGMRVQVCGGGMENRGWGVESVAVGVGGSVLWLLLFFVFISGGWWYRQRWLRWDGVGDQHALRARARLAC